MARSSDSDPLDRFRFRVSLDDLPAVGTESVVAFQAGFAACSAPKRSTNKIIYREGQDASIVFNSAGISTMEEIVLSRGVVTGNNVFYRWARRIHNPDAKFGEPGEVGVTSNEAFNEYRGTIKIEMLSRTGIPLRTWKLFNCFPISFVPGSDLDATADDSKSIAALTLIYDDFTEE